MLDLLYIGFDGMDPLIVKQKGLFADFCLSVATAPIAATGPSWTTMNTSLPPEEHGVYQCHGLKMDIEKDVTYHDSSAFAELGNIFFWDYLNAAGMTCGLMNVPITWPPRVIDGWMVSGIPALDRDRMCYPPEFREYVISDYWMGVLDKIRNDMSWLPGSPTRTVPGMEDKGLTNKTVLDFLQNKGFPFFMEAQLKMSRDRLRILHNIMAEHPVNCLFYQDVFLDEFNHIFMYHEDETERMPILYDLAVEITAELMEKYPAKTTILVSDHGGRSGRHYPDGVFGIKSDRVRKQGAACQIQDILPTTLYLMGIHEPIKQQKLRGRVLYELIEEYNLGASEQEEVKKHLKALGYI